MYLNTTPGSTWQYQLADTTNGVGVDTLVTFTSSAPDTIMVGKVIIYIRTHYLHSMIM
ncbi:MAG TPA: hypothetical protein VN726_14900 [Hanamia sp.]|nr:hypothetical protein [Hanamia sp.]